MVEVVEVAVAVAVAIAVAVGWMSGRKELAEVVRFGAGK